MHRKLPVGAQHAAPLQLQSLTSRLFFGCRFRRTADDAEADVFRRGRAVRFWIGGTFFASAHHFSLAVARQHPLGNIAPTGGDPLLLFLSPSLETAVFLLKRCRATQLSLH